MDDPEGNLLIVERVGHESQRRFPYWEYGWVGTAHSTEQHCIWHATHADACDPSGSASPTLPYASLRRISWHFPQIRWHTGRQPNVMYKSKRKFPS